MSSYHLDHLQYLETEAIHILREVAAEFERPVILFSGGKDSICILRLAEKAFRPSSLPRPSALKVRSSISRPATNSLNSLNSEIAGRKNSEPS